MGEVLPKAVWLIAFLFISIHTSAQKAEIQFSKRDLTVEQALQQIENQTIYTVAYSKTQLDVKRSVKLETRKIGVKEALEMVLKGTGLTYQVQGNHLIISTTDGGVQPSGKKPTQTVRGVIIDSQTKVPIEFASVQIVELPTLGSVTDSLGRFRLSNIPVGRYTIQTSLMGYRTQLITELSVTSSKEVYLVISVDEDIHRLNEVVIQPEISKDRLVNPMAITGGRMISMEEASRFANGFDDPARLSAAFAGVAGDIGTNAIAIRGNSPQFTQWRLEGIEIPNPTHFADLAGLGGGFLSALSTQVIGNSDFYNGAFPAEYSNALSGVFDMHMRNGNNQRYEHTFQFGLLGIDLASEGPISKKQGSSYLVNYRFSTTSLASGNDINLKYQDLAFKLNFPTQRSGTFSIWGLGLLDRNKTKPLERSEWVTIGDRQFGTNQLDKAAAGVAHQYLINDQTYIRSSLAATYAQDHTMVNQETETGGRVSVGDIQNSKWDLLFNAYLNKKFSSNHVNRTGITVTGLMYDLDYKISPYFGLDIPMEQIAKGNGQSLVLSAYSTSMIDLNRNLTASLGVNAQYFTLNKNWSIEPRVALKWRMQPRHALSFAYGLHSRREKLDYYFVEKEVNGQTESNRYLDFSRAHHFGITYDWNINQGLHFKVEPYYQYLFDIPVEANSSFSIINYQEVYLDRILKNKGRGVNYGIDLTLEQYMKNGFYYMLTGSLFKSRYKGSDHIWRNTRMDKSYLMNIVAGKEWMVGKRKQHVFSVNGRIFFQGGGCYTPVDEDRSLDEHDIVFDESKAFSKRFKPSVNGDLAIGYRINKKKISHEFSLKVLNVGVRTGMHFYQYNEKIHRIESKDGNGCIPNISYKIYF